MRPIWIGCALGLLVLAGTQSAAASGIKVKGPSIEVDPATYDFGTLPQESIQRLRVLIRSAGTEPVVIREVKTDCGCTVAQLPDSVLAPGDTTSLRVSLATRHSSGPITKHVFLTTNDPAAPKLRIKLTAYVRELVAVRPSTVDFGSVPRGETPARNVTIKAALKDSLEIQEVVLPVESFDSQLEKTAEGDSTVYRLRIKVRPDAPVGTFSETARLQTNLRTLRTVNFSLKGQIHSFFKVDPPILALGQVRRGTVRQRAVRLVAQRPGKHQVTGAKLSGESLDLDVKTIEEGRIYEVMVTIPPDARVGQIRGMLRIETDDPDQPEILITVQGNVRNAAGPRG